MSFRDKTKKLLDTAMNVFGEKEKVKYRPQSGGTFFIRGVFDEVWEEVDPETGMIISSSAPNIGVQLSELGLKPQSGDELDVNDRTYRVTDVHEDGQGGATLTLHLLES